MQVARDAAKPLIERIKAIIIAPCGEREMSHHFAFPNDTTASTPG